PDPIYPECVSDAQSTSRSAFESGLQYPPAGGIADSRKEVGPELCTPELQPSGVEKTVVTPHPSAMPCYNCARPSPSRSLNTDGA
ncbi:hypothetical protein A2U01_0087277, partial [Trifolium medium]|nr:hypothetical protein [Trifolium medium]